MLKEILQQLFGFSILIGYANLVIYLVLYDTTYIKGIKQYFKYSNGIMIIVNITFFGIVTGYFLLKYCSQ